MIAPVRVKPVLLAGIVLLLVWIDQASAADECVLRRLTSIPMSTSRIGAATIPLKIGSQTVTMLVDTGGAASALSETTATQLGLSPHDYNRRIWNNFDGERYDRFVVADGVDLGGLKADGIEFGFVPAGRLSSDLDGTITPLILQNYDVELDFANGMFSLYSRHHCPGQFAHWTDGDYAKIEFSADKFGLINVPVDIDGKEVRALIHTGYVRSVLAFDEVSMKFGIDENDPNLQRLPGIPHARDYYYPFKKLTLGGVTVNNPHIELLSYDTPRLMPGQHPLVLGLDVLRQLHLYISYGEHVMYVTPASAH
jgi:predicted aspartyl protease